jgi:tetratricopeptide (TPR) repeat protein
MGSGNLRKFRKHSLYFRTYVPSFILCVFWSVACIASADSGAEDAVKLIMESRQLKEEINLAGATLKEFIGDDPILSGLEQISLKSYTLPETPDDPARAISEHISDEIKAEGWQRIHFRIDEGGTVIIGGKERDGKRDRLRIVIIDPPELSEMNLVGEMELSALDRLRNVIEQSMPSFSKPTKVPSSPSQRANDTVMELQYTIERERKEALTELYKIAESHKQLGEYERAMDVYERTMLPWKISNLGEWLQMQIYQDAAYCNERLGRFDQAGKYYKILLEKFGKNVEVAKNASKSLERLKGWENTEKRIELLKAVIEEDDTPLLRGKLGLTYQQAAMYDSALEQYNIIIDEHQDYRELSAIYLNAGICSESLNMVDKAKEYYTILAERFKGDHQHGVMAEKALIRIARGDDQPSLGLGLRFNYSETKNGVKVVTVFKNGPAKLAGIRPEDIILAIDSKPTHSARSIIKIIGWEKNIGDEVILRVRSNMQEMQVPVILIKTPEKLER